MSRELRSATAVFMVGITCGVLGVYIPDPDVAFLYIVVISIIFSVFAFIDIEGNE